MMLCLASSIVHCQGDFDVADQVRRYRAWFEQGVMSCMGVCFDIGVSTRLALGIWKGGPGEEEADMNSKQRKINERLDRESCCGNGSLMRCVPIPLVYYAEPGRAEEFAGMQSAVTHPHVTCREACQIYTRMVGGVLRRRGEGGKEAVFMDLKGFEFAGSGVLRETISRYKQVGDWEGVPEGEIKSSGFVVHTLEAALWAFFTTGSLREGALKVVNLGDDADTVGAVYGGLAGAYYGMEGVPREWMDGLYAKGIVDEVVEGIVRLMDAKEKRVYGERGQENAF